MKGSVLMSGLVGLAVIAGVGLWYTTERAYYYELEGVTEVMAYGDAFPVSDFQGIDADTSPLKMRACFTVDWDYWPSDKHKEAATPLTAPRFFDCFNAEQITKDLAADQATAILSDENNPYGFDTYIAQYPDGRAFMWRQINACGEASFSGDDLPEGCPVRTDTQSSLEILLEPANGGAPEPVAKAIEVAGQAQNLRGCFETEMSMAMISETYAITDTLLPATDGPACFDHAAMNTLLAQGMALTIMGERNFRNGYDRMVAVTQDGKGLFWSIPSEGQ